MMQRLHLAAWLLITFVCASAATTASAQKISEPIPRDLNVDVSINQIGYAPEAAKYLTLPGEHPQTFEVRRLPSNEVVYRGTARPAGGDFGAYLVGDFSEVNKPGTYYIETDYARSWPFRISLGIYEGAMRKIVFYFGKQRCGASRTGYLSPCHLDDGIRRDDGKHLDVIGGWHDASDLRKGVANTLYGMVGLANLLELMPCWHRGRVLEELRWGNKYFLKMQEPEGHVMRSIGSELRAHGDENRWTDNDIGPEGGQLHTVAPTAGITSASITIFGSKDDRVIKTKPAFDIGQFMFVVSEAKMARLTRKSQPAYARRCLRAARRAFDWILEAGITNTAGDYAALIQAAVAMHKATGEEHYRERAASAARKLLELQVTEPVGTEPTIRGFFRTSADSSDPYRPISGPPVQAIEGLPLLGLSVLVEAFPEHEDAAVWKEAIAMYAQDYLLPLVHQNAFGIVPFALFAEAPGGDRRVGPYWYRYFMLPEGWWVGINANLAMKGVGLMKAARILEDPRLAALAQRQFDWIVGANPFLASTIVGVGYNHPGRFVNGSEFRPATPRIMGAVMNGLGGTEEDEPALYNGSYHTAEYWTPMVGYTLWLMAELQQGI